MYEFRRTDNQKKSCDISRHTIRNVLRLNNKLHPAVDIPEDVIDETPNIFPAVESQDDDDNELFKFISKLENKPSGLTELLKNLNKKK